MAGGYGSEYAVELPQGNSTQTLQWALQQRERLHQEKLLREKQTRDQQEDLTKFLDNELDYTKFATGTAADPVNIGAISDLRKKYASGILSGQYSNTAGLLYDMQNDVGKIATYSNNAKQVQANINQSLESYKGKEGIDIDALRKGAIRTAFMKIDPATGQPVVNEQQLNPQQDYVNKYFNDYPEKVLTGPQALVKSFSGMKTTNLSDVTQTDYKGTKRKIKWTADLLPHQEIDYKNGEPVGVKFKTEDIKLPNNKTVKALPDAAMQEFFGDPINQKYLKMQMKQEYPNLIEGTQEYETASKKVGLDIANQFARGSKFTKEDLTDQDVWRGKQQAGININVGKEKKENVFEVLKNIRAGDLSYVSNQQPDGKGLIEITPGLPGGILYSGRIKKSRDGTASKEAFNAVYYNPTTKTFWVQDERRGKSGELTMIPPSKEKEEFQKIAEANGVPVKDFLKIWGEGEEPMKPLKGFPGSGIINRVFGAKKPKDEPATDSNSKKKKYNAATGKFE